MMQHIHIICVAKFLWFLQIDTFLLVSMHKIIRNKLVSAADVSAIHINHILTVTYIHTYMVHMCKIHICTKMLHLIVTVWVY